MAECVWCHDPVASEGDTCDLGCYKSFYAWVHTLLNRLNRGFVTFQPHETPPSPLYEQPWYETTAELEDYL